MLYEIIFIGRMGGVSYSGKKKGLFLDQDIRFVYMGGFFVLFCFLFEGKLLAKVFLLCRLLLFSLGWIW